MEMLVTDATPRWFFRSHRSYVYKGPPSWRWVNLGQDLDEAIARYRELVQARRVHVRRAIRERLALETTAAIRSVAHWGVRLQSLVGPMWSRGATSASDRGLAWRLSRDDIAALLLRSAGCCEVSGIEFSEETVGKRKLRPWMPTLDRIDAALGYEAGNVRLVCLAANNALADFGDATLIRLARAIAKRNP